MQVSRLESRQKEKLQRKKKVKRVIIINFILLGLIIILLGVWLAAENSERLQKWFSSSSGPEMSQSIDSDGQGESKGSNINNEGKSSNPNNDSGPEMGSKDGSSASPVPSSEPELIEDDKVSLSFVGDIHIGEYTSHITSSKGYDHLFKPSLFYLLEPDLTAGNLEYPVTERGTPVTGMKYVYKGSPETLPPMRDAGFDIMNLANNHALDQGVEGMLDTMMHLEEAGISHIGVGNDDIEAYKPVIKEVRGTKIAYLGLSRVVPANEWKAEKYRAGVADTYDTTRAVQAIAKANEQADIVVVMVHWGIMYNDQPEKYQRNFARQYIDAGADLVIGSHPHVLQGFESYKGKWIAYSLGNFLFTTYPKGTEAETGVLDAVCSKDGECDLTFYPMKIIEAQPTPLDGDEAQLLLDRLTSISLGVELDENGLLTSVESVPLD